MRMFLKRALVAMGLIALGGYASAFTYDAGGPLEGPKLPPFPTQQGEPAGQPGCIPALAATGEVTEDMGNVMREYSAQGQFGLLQLYPDSVENWRAYWLKYVPVRSMVDADSLIQNWTAPNIPHSGTFRVEQYAAPVYWVPRHKDPKATGRFNKPVPVVRAGVKAPVFDLDLGERAVGMFVVRVIGAVETKNIAPARAPLYMMMTVNDGPNGEENKYRLRLGFQDEFYSVAEFYFHAPAARRYKARLWVDEGSTVELLIHNIDLHDVLTGTARRPVKQKMMLSTPEERDALRRLKVKDLNRITKVIENLDQRLATDALVWESLPPLNTQIGGIYGLNKERHGYSEKAVFGANGKSIADLNAEYGDWKPWPARYPTGLTRTLLTNEKLKAEYTMADLAALKPLPAPYPVQDTGAGVVTPGKAGESQQEFTIIADAAAGRFNPFFHTLMRNVNAYNETGNYEAGWTAAMQLCRVAWQYPSLDGTQTLGALITDPGGFQREMRCRRRDPSIKIGTGNGFDYPQLLSAYDKVFDVVKGNDQFAQSLGRFIPWVKTSDDVVTLMDVYLVQMMAKQIVRFNMLSDNQPAMIVEPASVLGDRTVTDPWLAWLWAKAYIYPNPPAGLGPVLVTGNDRNGVGYIASWMYCHGEEASKNGELLAEYIAGGGDTKYDLRDARLYPKVTAACYWPLQTSFAGLYWPRVGDVTGPDKPYASLFNNFEVKMHRGWQWTKDPVFAWMIKNHFARKAESDEEWAELEKAAATVTRAPYLAQGSRVMINWFGLLESGTSHDDPRFRRAAMLRVGQGYGHQHNDTLDLHVYAHGYPFVIDDGQRAGYTSGSSASTKWHNMVQVEDKNWLGHSWVRTLSDVEGARYMQAEAVPPADLPNVTSYRRQVALLDVDEGQGAAPVTPRAVATGQGLPQGVVTPNSYVLDVVRVSGGKKHTYNFHAALDDEITSNAENLQPSTNGVREGFPTSTHGFTGVAPEELTATWRMTRDNIGGGFGEMRMAPWFNENSPRKYTRLHVLGQKGARVSTDWTFCKQWKYGFTNLYTTREEAADMDSVFPAIIEPYVGEPFITGTRLLPITGNDADAARAVAVEVRTKNGHTDMLFADGSPDKVRAVDGSHFAGEFGFVSRDGDGLRQVTLVGGTQLRLPEAALQLSVRERSAKIVAVDYREHRMEIDQAWPAGTFLKKSSFEVGAPGRMTTYEIASVGADGRSIQVQGSADLFLSRIASIDTEKREVGCTLGMPFLAGAPCPGRNRDLVASNEAGTKFWRAEYLGRPKDDTDAKSYFFRLDGPVTPDDFGKDGFRLWEFGVGDVVRQSAFAGLRRVGERVYEVTANMDVTVALKTDGIEIMAAGKGWAPARTAKAGDKLAVKITLADLGETGSVRLRVK